MISELGDADFPTSTIIRNYRRKCNSLKGENAKDGTFSMISRP